MKKIIQYSVILSLFMPAAYTSANDQLYGKAIPRDAAFVRALGFDTPSGDNQFGLELSATGDYTVVLNGTVEGVEPQQVITVTPFGTISHDVTADRSKVQVALFNGGYPSPIALKTADGKIEITSAAPQTATFRDVNPLVIPVAVFSGNETLGAPFDLTLIRGKNPTVWVDSNGNTEVVISEVIWEE